MSFQSTLFIVFFCALLAVLALTKKEKIRQIEILAASIVFYAVWDVRFLGLIAICIMVAHVSVFFTLKNRSNEGGFDKLALGIGVGVQLVILCIFKYLNFFVSGFASMLGMEYIGNLIHILPIGISFYIFSAIGYMIDVYRGDIETQPALYEEALYILFFPKLLQGPLHKATDFYKQLEREHPIQIQNLEVGVQIFLFGLIKKIVIADRLGLFVDSVYENPVAYSGGTLLLAAITYPIQLYCDFSGYSDMAVATAKMMGYELCANFDLPFLSRSVAEYWRRWHMSLNVWFRDYLFYPVIRSGWVNSLRKKAKNKSKKLARNLPSVIGMSIVWPLIGLWHGASMNFILYGCFYGVMMIVGQLLAEEEKDGIVGVLRVVRTWMITILTLVLFRATTLEDANAVFAGIFMWQRGISYCYTWSLIMIPLVMAVCVCAYKTNHGNGYYPCVDLSKLRGKVIFCTAVLLTIVLMYVGENYFMYFQF